MLLMLLGPQCQIWNMRIMGARSMFENCRLRQHSMQIGLSLLFGLATLATTLNANGVTLLQPDLLDVSLPNILSAIPGTLIFLALLGALPSLVPRYPVRPQLDTLYILMALSSACLLAPAFGLHVCRLELS